MIAPNIVMEDNNGDTHNIWFNSVFCIPSQNIDGFCPSRIIQEELCTTLLTFYRNIYQTFDANPQALYYKGMLHELQLQHLENLRGAIQSTYAENIREILHDNSSLTFQKIALPNSPDALMEMEWKPQEA